MIVKMKLYERKAVLQGNQFKYWQDIINVKESYLIGYRQALEDLANGIDPNQEVEVEFRDGEHQVGMR